MSYTIQWGEGEYEFKVEAPTKREAMKMYRDLGGTELCYADDAAYNPFPKE